MLLYFSSYYAFLDSSWNLYRTCLVVAMGNALEADSTPRRPISDTCGSSACLSAAACVRASTKHAHNSSDQSRLIVFFTMFQFAGKYTYKCPP
uniref:Uncharacterized protein n=1 Tax=Arundo donax TaxID=35708 RepID=A0A0A9DY45_ARUDO